MKPQCQTKCGREADPSHFLCSECYSQVPQAMLNALARYPLLIKQTRNPRLQLKYTQLQREARTAAVQWVVDRRNKEKVEA